MSVFLRVRSVKPHHRWQSKKLSARVSPIWIPSASHRDFWAIMDFKSRLKLTALPSLLKPAASEATI
jgi:hypothetical protein